MAVHSRHINDLLTHPKDPLTSRLKPLSSSSFHPPQNPLVILTSHPTSTPRCQRPPQRRCILVTYPDPSHHPTTTTMHHAPHISTHQLQATSARLFAPFIKPPRYPIRPAPPSLASSRLPPPAAEVDERPTYRVRRFRLWRDNAPELRKVVLDPKRRSEFCHTCGTMERD